MVEIITYSLNVDNHSSDKYYQEISEFTDIVLAICAHQAGDILHAFQQHIERNDLETLRTLPEYQFEFLTLGMLYRIYAGEAQTLAQPSQKILSLLYRLRKKNRILKPMADQIRGIISGLVSRSPAVPVDVSTSAENSGSIIEVDGSQRRIF